MDQLQHPAVTTGNPIPIILRDLLFSLYGLLRALCKLPTCSLDYNPENLYAFRIIQSGQLWSIKGTSPPIFTVLYIHFHHSLSLSLSLSTLSQISNTTNFVQIWSFVAQKHRISTLVKHHRRLVRFLYTCMINLSDFFFEFWSGAIRISFSGLDCCSPGIEIRKHPECFFASVLCCLIVILITLIWLP